MKRVLIMQCPAISHLNASFRVADVLRKHQYEVFYFSNNVVAEHAVKNGYNFCNAATSSIVEKYDNKMMKLDNLTYSYFERFRDAAMGIVFESRKHEVRTVIEKIKPDIIIADTFVGSDFAFIYDMLKEKGIKFFHMETMPSTIERLDVPYFDSFAFPEQKLKMYAEHLKRKFGRRLIRFWRRLIYFGYDNFSQLKREIERQKIPERYRIEIRDYCDLRLAGIPCLLTLPLELEFFKQPVNLQDHYLGFFVNNKTKDNPDVDERLAQLIDSPKPIIYISFGTVFGAVRADDILRFMKRMNEVMKQLRDVTAIFSLGKVRWTQDDLKQLTHINVFNFVPQIYLLRFCSLFITHGGLNSIKESIQEAVPMLVLPLDIDQIGNARKITHKRLGLLGDIKRETTKALTKKIELLLYDKSYKHNLEAFREIINTGYDVETQLMPIIDSEGVVE